MLRNGCEMNLTAMDYIRAALANAIASNLSLTDAARMAEHATTPQEFDKAVNMLATATPQRQTPL